MYLEFLSPPLVTNVLPHDISIALHSEQEKATNHLVIRLFYNDSANTMWYRYYQSKYVNTTISLPFPHTSFSVAHIYPFPIVIDYVI